MNHKSISLQPLSEAHFAAVIALGNRVHGDGYLDDTSMLEYFQRGIKHDINAGVVALLDEKEVGFHLVIATE